MRRILNAIAGFRSGWSTLEAAGPVRSGAGGCSVCLGAHDDEIHAATVRVHRWFRAKVTKGFEPQGIWR